MMVTMLHRAFWAVSERRSTQPASRNRLPSISIPIKAAVSGMSMITTQETMMGKMTFSALETLRSWPILMTRSFLVVRAFMMGGWISGISAM